MPTPALDPGWTTSSEDGRVNPAGLSPVTELPTGDPDATTPLVNPKSNGTLLVIGEPDSPLDDNSELSRSASIGLDQVSITEPGPVDP